MTVLKTTLISTLLVAMFGCKTDDSTKRTDGYSPAYQQCVTPTDEKCVGGAEAGVQIPIPEARDKSLPRAETTIFGRCEMEVAGEKGSKPCDGVKLMFRAVHEGEERTVVVNGYDFKIEDLNQSTYNLDATHENYDLVTDTKQLSPGHSVKIKVKAKPRL